MPLNSSVLSSSIQENVGSINAGGGKSIKEIISPSALQEFCDAIAEAVVNHITNHAVVNVKMLSHMHSVTSVGTPTGIALPTSNQETGTII